MYISRFSKLYKRFILFLLASSSLSAEKNLLDPMVVSSLRLETENRSLPARIQVIDQAEIEQSGATDIVGLLRKEANLQVRSTSGNSARSTVSMGGFGDNAGHRTLVLLDGHRLNAFDLSPINWHSIPGYDQINRGDSWSPMNWHSLWESLSGWGNQDQHQAA